MRDRERAAAAPSNISRRHEATTANTCRFFRLPNALILDILSRLPIKDLLHCKRVCKSFLCFVSDHEFVCLHLSRSPCCIVFFTGPTENASKRLKLGHVDADGANFQVSELNFTPNVLTSDIFHATACNGLLLFHQPDGSFYVCNPILGEFITIKPAYKDRNRGSIWGLGYSTVINQYKVLQTYYTAEQANRCVMVEIYTIGTGSWRSIGIAPTNHVLSPSDAFLNGSLHWSYISPGIGECILSFDFDAEQFGRVPLPAQFLKLKQFAGIPKIGVMGGCLSIIHSTNSTQVNIWVMKEYGVKESWTNHFAFKDLPLNGRVFQQPVVLLSNEEMLILYNHNLIVCYGKKRKQPRGTKFFRTHSQFYPVAYTASFVSLYNVAKGEQISRCSSLINSEIVANEVEG